MIYKYGIDYGTTNSSIAICYGNSSDSHLKVIDVENSMPKTVMPSKVVLSTDLRLHVGRNATSAVDSKRVVREVKMLLDSNPNQKIEVGKRNYPLSYFIGAVLKNLKIKADQFCQQCGIVPDGVVMGVPVEFSDEKKAVLKKALVEAGFYESYEEAGEKTEFISEPLAVAIDYGEKINSDTTVFVFDFGGGTLDIAVMNLKKQIAMLGQDKLHPHDVITKERQTIGGEKLTKAFFVNSFCSDKKYGCNKLCKAFGLPSGLSPTELWDSIMEIDKEGDKFFEAVDALKISLSSKEFANFSYMSPLGAIDIIPFYRSDFENAIRKPIPGENKSAFDLIEDVVNKVLRNKKVDGIAGIDDALVAGGSSMIPCVQEYLYNVFTNCLHDNVGQTDALNSIVRGLALVGCKEEEIVEDVVDCEYGFIDVERKEFVPVIRKGTKVKDTAFNRSTFEGCKLDIRALDPLNNRMTITVKQRIGENTTELGKINIEAEGKMRYTLFMTVDRKQSVLRCYVYDRDEKVWLDDTGELSTKECEYKLKFN